MNFKKLITGIGLGILGLATLGSVARADNSFPLVDDFAGSHQLNVHSVGGFTYERTSGALNQTRVTLSRVYFTRSTWNVLHDNAPYAVECGTLKVTPYVEYGSLNSLTLNFGKGQSLRVTQPTWGVLSINFMGLILESDVKEPMVTVEFCDGLNTLTVGNTTKSMDRTSDLAVTPVSIVATNNGTATTSTTSRMNSLSITPNADVVVPVEPVEPVEEPVVEPIDTDGDGVLDADDACMFRHGQGSPDGCPVEPVPTPTVTQADLDALEAKMTANMSTIEAQTMEAVKNGANNTFTVLAGINQQQKDAAERQAALEAQNAELVEEVGRLQGLWNSIKSFFSFLDIAEEDMPQELPTASEQVTVPGTIAVVQYPDVKKKDEVAQLEARIVELERQVRDNRQEIIGLAGFVNQQVDRVTGVIKVVNKIASLFRKMGNTPDNHNT